MFRVKSNSRRRLAPEGFAPLMLVTFLVLFPTAPVSAEVRDRSAEARGRFEEPAKIGKKLQQGLAGIAFGFLEVPGTICTLWRSGPSSPSIRR